MSQYYKNKPQKPAVLQVSNQWHHQRGQCPELKTWVQSETKTHHLFCTLVLCGFVQTEVPFFQETALTVLSRKLSGVVLCCARSLFTYMAGCGCSSVHATMSLFSSVSLKNYALSIPCCWSFTTPIKEVQHVFVTSTTLISGLLAIAMKPGMRNNEGLSVVSSVLSPTNWHAEVINILLWYVDPRVTLQNDLKIL